MLSNKLMALLSLGFGLGLAMIIYSERWWLPVVEPNKAFGFSILGIGVVLMSFCFFLVMKTKQ